MPQIKITVSQIKSTVSQIKSTVSQIKSIVSHIKNTVSVIKVLVSHMKITASQITVKDQEQCSKDHGQIFPDQAHLVTDQDHWDTDQDHLVTDQDHWETDQDHWDTDQDHWVTDQDPWVTDQNHWVTDQDHWVTDYTVGLLNRSLEAQCEKSWSHKHCVPRIRNALSQIRNKFSQDQEQFVPRFPWYRLQDCWFGSCYLDPEVRDFTGGSIIQFQILSKPNKQRLLTKKTYDLLLFANPLWVEWDLYILREDPEQEPDSATKWEPDLIPETIMDPDFFNNPNFRLNEQRPNPKSLTRG